MDSALFSSLLPKILTSLCEHSSTFFLQDVNGANKALVKVIEDVEEKAWSVISYDIPNENLFNYAESFINPEAELIDAELGKIGNETESFYRLLFKLKHLNIMSSGGANFPASSEESILLTYNKLKEIYSKEKSSLIKFEKSFSALIEKSWLEQYCRSAELVLREDFLLIENRLKQAGLLY